MVYLYFKRNRRLIHAFVCKFVVHDTLTAVTVYWHRRFGRSQNGRAASIAAACGEIPRSLRRASSSFAKARRWVHTVKAVVMNGNLAVPRLREIWAWAGLRVNVMSCPFVMQCHCFIRYVDISTILRHNENE
jgi:hypothetical protein